MKHAKFLPLVLLMSAGVIAISACSPQATTPVDTRLDAGLVKTDSKLGTGAEAVSGHLVKVHYTGWLYDAAAPEHKGKKFDSSRDRNNPFMFPLGEGRVIKGWDQGVAGMKVGGQRTLVIPAHLGYGVRDMGVIPPNSMLLFEVELLGVNE